MGKYGIRFDGEKTIWTYEAKDVAEAIQKHYESSRKHGCPLYTGTYEVFTVHDIDTGEEHQCEFEIVESANIPFRNFDKGDRREIGTFTLALMECKCGKREWSASGKIELIDEWEQALNERFDRGETFERPICRVR